MTTAPEGSARRRLQYAKWRDGATASYVRLYLTVSLVRHHQFGEISNLEFPYKSDELTLLCYFMNFSVSLGANVFSVAYDDFYCSMQNLIDCIKMIILVWIGIFIISLVTLDEMYYLTYFMYV